MLLPIPTPALARLLSPSLKGTRGQPHAVVFFTPEPVSPLGSPQVFFQLQHPLPVGEAALPD